MAFDFAAIRDKSRELLAAAKDRAVQFKKQAAPHVDRIAETAAKKVTEVTGRDTSASDIKKAAVVAAIGLSVIALAASSGGAVVPSGLSSFSEGGSGSGDVMEQAHTFFSRNGGSLTIETHTIDQDGCILD